MAVTREVVSHAGSVIAFMLLPVLTSFPNTSSGPNAITKNIMTSRVVHYVDKGDACDLDAR